MMLRRTKYGKRIRKENWGNVDKMAQTNLGYFKQIWS